MNISKEIVLIIIFLFFSIVNFILLLINNSRIKKYKRYYEKTLAKFNSHENVNDEFNLIYDRIRNVEELSKNTIEIVDKFEEKIKNNVQKIGFVKYNAYDETDNKLSFALAMLDDRNDGITINYIYSKHGGNIYAKLVSNGNTEERLSEEEALAIKNACDDKDFKARNILEVNKTKTRRMKKKY